MVGIFAKSANQLKEMVFAMYNLKIFLNIVLGQKKKKKTGNWDSQEMVPNGKEISAILFQTKEEDYVVR